MMAALPVRSPDLSWEVKSFETGIVGVPVGKLHLSGDDHGADLPSRAHHLETRRIEWQNEGVWLVSCRIPSTWHHAHDDLQAIGFRPVETLVTFFQAARPATLTTIDVGLARPYEFDACIDLALRAFTFDRLHRDSLIPDHVADTIRAAWVRNDLSGRAAAPLVAHVQDQVVGFNLCLKSDNVAIIDLIAVAPDHQRQSIAAQMVEAAFAHFGDTIAGIRVGTQANNLASMKLYERSGFVEERRETTLHWVNPAVRPKKTAIAQFEVRS